MNYSSVAYNNKIFSFLKQLFTNIVVALCIILVFAFAMQFFMKVEYFRVLSNSEAPIFYRNSLVISKPQQNYIPGDICVFNYNGNVVTHRLIAIVKDDNNIEYYVFHGDNVQSVDLESGSVIGSDWKTEAGYVGSHDYNWVKNNARNVQTTNKTAIKGKVILHFNKIGGFFQIVQDHKAIVIVLIVGIWIVAYAIEAELEALKQRRLLA